MYDNAYMWEEVPAAKKGDKPQKIYRGEFLSFEEALAWKKKQAHPDRFRVNNVAPTAVVREHRENPEAVEADADKSFAYEAVKDYLDNPASRAYFPTKEAPRATEKPRAARRAPAFDWNRPIRETAPVAPPRHLSEDELALQADAAKELAKAKKDEAREIA